MIYDPVRDRMIVFGGNNGGIGYFGDTWALALGTGPAWSRLVDRDTIARGAHTAIYDPLRDRMIVFGGERTYDPIVPWVLNDTWALALNGNPSWSQLSPGGTTPPARRLHVAIYDPVRDRMIAFGGYNSTLFGDTWALSLGGIPAWSALSPSGSPPAPRYGATSLYDRVRDRMVLFGGSRGINLNDTWALSLASGTTWSQLAPTGGPPAARTLQSMLYDPSRDRMLVTGGSGGTVAPGDNWALTWGAPMFAGVGCGTDTSAGPGNSITLTWSVTNPDAFDQNVDYSLKSSRGWPGFPIAGTSLVPAGATSQISIPVQVPDTAAVGASALDFRATLRAVPQSVSCDRVLTVDAVVSAPNPSSSLPLALKGAAPNPSLGYLQVGFVLPDAEPAIIEAFDIAGRRVFVQNVGPLGAGHHTLRLHTSRRLAAGVYVIRLSRAAQSLATRAVVLP
jgi:hypothetical protein